MHTTTTLGRPLAALLVPLLAGTAAVAGDGTGLHFQHHDWELACDNTGSCRAAGYQAGEDGLAVSVLLERQAGPAQPVRGRLRLGDVGGTPGVGEATLRIDGRSLGGLNFGGDVTAPLSDAQVAALLAALRRDSRITVDAGEAGEWRLSDRGASAVLLKMDEVQGRLGTRGALVRRGDADEAQVPPARPLPEIRVPPLAATRGEDAAVARDPVLLAALRAATDADACERLHGDEAVQLQVERLDERHLLVSTACWLAAYNSGDGYWIVSAQPPYAPRLVTADASFHADGIIRAYQKGRGLGDCAWRMEWAWDGRDFVPAFEATTGLCRLVADGGAWELHTRVSRILR